MPAATVIQDAPPLGMAPRVAPRAAPRCTAADVDRLLGHLKHAKHWHVARAEFPTDLVLRPDAADAVLRRYGKRGRDLTTGQIMGMTIRVGSPGMRSYFSIHCFDGVNRRCRGCGMTHLEFNLDPTPRECAGRPSTDAPLGRIG